MKTPLPVELRTDRVNVLTPKELQTVCTPVERGEFIADILTKMKIGVAGGVGLAANQVGETKRIILVNTGSVRQFLINPVIVKKYGGTIMSTEGCLSFPGRRVRVVRNKQIIVEGFSPDWKPLRFKFQGLNAIVVQHEVDHLDGITCVDKAVRELAC